VYTKIPKGRKGTIAVQPGGADWDHDELDPAVIATLKAAGGHAAAAAGEAAAAAEPAAGAAAGVAGAPAAAQAQAMLLFALAAAGGNATGVAQGGPGSMDVDG